jgi:hypothetical protein
VSSNKHATDMLASRTASNISNVLSVISYSPLINVWYVGDS